jgi:hypothetical protein
MADKEAAAKRATEEAATKMAAVGAPASSLLPPSFFFFLLPPLLLALPRAWAPTLGVVLSPFAGWAAGECQAGPSTALVHLSARLKSTDTSWMPWVVSFSSIFSSPTWRAKC